MVYPPLFFYLAAALARIIGIGFLSLRLVSFLSTLGCLICIHALVNYKTRSTVIGVVSAGSFVATFRLGGAWFDIARVDMLFIFLSLAGVYLLLNQSLKSSIFAGFLFSLALFTKQTALPIFIATALSTILLFREKALFFIGSFTLLSLISFLYLGFTTRGWYFYYIYTLPSSFQIRWSSLFSTLLAAFEPLAVIIIIAILPLFLAVRKIYQDKHYLFYYLVTIGFITAGVAARLGHEAYDNNIIPGYAGLSILFGLGMEWLASYIDLTRINKSIIKSTIWLAIIVQFMLLGYDPIRQIPTLADQRAGDTLVENLKSVEGDVFIPYDNYLALFAGKKIYLHFVALDGMRSTRAQLRPEVRDILKQFNSTPFSLFIMDLPDNLIQKKHCEDTQNIQYVSADTFYPVTGYSVRPSIESINCP
jgi:hypothetical protein